MKDSSEGEELACLASLESSQQIQPCFIANTTFLHSKVNKRTNCTCYLSDLSGKAKYCSISK